MSDETSADLQTYLDELHMKEKELTLFFRELKYNYEKNNMSLEEIQEELYFELATATNDEDSINIAPYLVQAVVVGILWEQSDTEVSIDA